MTTYRIEQGTTEHAVAMATLTYIGHDGKISTFSDLGLHQLREAYEERIASPGGGFCVICGKAIDYNDEDWMEADGGGDICAACWRDAQADDDPEELPDTTAEQFAAMRGTY